jgi:hypothetical protein
MSLKDYPPPACFLTSSNITKSRSFQQRQLLAEPLYQSLEKQNRITTDMDWHNRRITVMGLGHFGGGAGAARWLAQQGAQVTVTEQAGAEVLQEALKYLHGIPIAEFHLGGHR